MSTSICETLGKHQGLQLDGVRHPGHLVVFCTACKQEVPEEQAKAEVADDPQTEQLVLVGVAAD